MEVLVVKINVGDTMGRYTTNDNRSMQCNANSEKYYLSRGYINDLTLQGYYR